MTWLLERMMALQFGWRDALDIGIVAFILYTILNLIRGTRAMQMSVGLLMLGGAFLLGRTLDLVALETLSRQILFYLPFAVIVLFQHEIRRALAAFGTNPLLSFFGRRPDDEGLSAIFEAANDLAAAKTGALIVIERTQSLRAYIESGRKVDATLSRELLVNLFAPNTPLHDGAVVIQAGRIAAASVFLPLSANLDISASHGTRHQAAVGLSEETDALVVVVSEEEGTISVAVEGTLIEALDRDALSALMGSRLGSVNGGSQS